MANKNNAKKKNTNNKKETNLNSNTKGVKMVKEKPVTSPKVEKVEIKEKKSFSLTSRQRDIILILLVVVLLVVGLILTSNRKQIDIELPVALKGEAGFTEITYTQYKEKMSNNEMFLVVIVRDGCGYCEMYEPILEEVANEKGLPIYYINLTNLTSEEVEELSNSNSYLRKNNWGTPTTLFMYGVNVVDSISGYVEKDSLLNFVEENFIVED